MKQVVLDGAVDVDSMGATTTLTALDGSHTRFDKSKSGVVKLSGGRVLQQTLLASNGVLCLIERP